MKRGMLIGVAGTFAIIFGACIGLSAAEKETMVERTDASEEATPSELSQGRRINAFLVEKILGSRVLNMKGEDLGVIKDIVIDVDRGSILYAVMDFGSVLGMGGKLFPVPWQSLAALPSEGIFFMQASKAKLEKAPGFDKDSLPDMGDVHWGEKILQFYGATREQRWSYEYGYGSEFGLEMYPHLTREDPFAEIYDPKSIKRISGQVIKVNWVIPKTGMTSQMEIKLIVYVDRKEVIPVYLGPVWYIRGPEQARPFKSGDQVTVTGSWITSEGAEPFMIASSVTRNNETLQLRDKDGTAVWSGWKRFRNSE
jgi:sporulation protein YlmC with PRC-barrel domain